MKAFTLIFLFITAALSSFAQLPTISTFPGNSVTAPGFSGATGTTMTINGTNFTGATAVSFGGVPASSFTVISPTQITAVVAGGASGILSVTTPGGTVTRAGFTYLPLSRIITDFGGYWSSTTASPSGIVPDSSHNLLGFAYNNIFYSTGAKDSILTARGISFTPGNYRAFPVSGISGTNAGGSVYLAVASKADGDPVTGNISGVSTATVRSVMIDGIRGLDLGTGVTNLPKSAVMTFNLSNIDITKISDAEPDLILTQIADPTSANDTLKFIDASGVTVGNSLTQDMLVLASFGSYKLDLFNLATTAYNSANPVSVFQSNVTRGVRLVGLKLSDFGITSGNAGSIRAMRVTPSGTSDYAFIAYNTKIITAAPNISQNDGASTASVCNNANAVLSVIGTASGNGALTYSWERSTDGGTVWTSIANGGNYSGATTNTLTVANPVTNDRYRATVTEGGSTNTSSGFTLTNSPTSVGGTVAGSTSVCTGTNSTTFTLTGHTGSVIRWESSFNSFSTVATIANTTTSLTVTNVSATTQYRAVVQSGACSSANSAVATVTYSASVGGSVAGSASVCTGTNSTPMTLSGHSGNILRWESSTNSFSSITTIANTTTTLTANNLTATTQYRAVVQSGVCVSANSLTATVTVSPTTVGGTIAGSASVCTGSNSTTLTLSGNTGTIVKWQSSADNFSSVITDIANTTTTLTANNLSATTQYRAVVQSGVCVSANSSTATVTVNPTTVGGSIAGSASVCTGSNSTTLTLSGNTGTIVKWQLSTDNFSSVITDIANTTTTLIATNLTATTQYRAVVQSGVCVSANSLTTTVTVNPTTVGGSIAGSASVCTGSNSTTLTLSGNTGTIVKWQLSTDNFSSVITDIANTTTTLTASNLSATTQYRAVVQSGICASANSSTATVTVSPTSVGGTIAGSASVCTGSNSTPLTLSGNTGTIVKWQSSTDNFSSVITDISNATITLTATNLTATTQYRAVVQSGNCASANSLSATVTVSPISVGGSIAGSASVCTGSNSTPLTLSGNTGTIVKWQSSTDNFSSVITDIANTTTTLTANNLTATTQYRAVVQSGVCVSANSSTATVTVNPTTVGGSIAGSASVCTGSNSTTLTLSGNTGTIVKWQSSTDNFSSVINDIANTTTTLTATNLSATTQFRAVVQSGICVSANSSTATVTVSPTSVGGSIGGSASVCTGSNSTTLTLSGNTGTIVKWQSSTDNFSSVITDIANTTTTLTANNLSATTQYRAVVQSGSCTSATSSVSTITVNAVGQWIGGANGDWNLPSNWCGGVPSTPSQVSIPSGSTVTITSANALASTVNIATGGNLILNGTSNLVISAGGTFTNNGAFDASASTTGKVSFAGNGTISGTTTFKNIDTYGALDFGTSSTISGEFTLQTGASVTGHSPTYLCPTSSLVYNVGGTYPRSLEWPSVSSGQGLPSNVIVKNSTTIDFPLEGAGYVCNDLTVESGSALLQTFSGSSAPLTVGRHVTIEGLLTLGADPGDDITLGGNWTRNPGGIFNANGRTVTFTSAVNSVITAPASAARDANGAFGGETFYNINLNKAAASNTVELGSNITVVNELKVTKGTFDLVNNDVTIVSNTSTTAHVAPVSATGATVNYSGTGRFIVQRHLSIGSGSTSRRWRMLTAPLQATGAPTISQAWQEGVSNANRNAPVDPWPGFGTTITKSTTYNAADGYDQGSTNNPSIYAPITTSGTMQWYTLPSTKVAITEREGYMLFARGNRSIVVSTPNINANTTILEPRGKINVGDIQKSILAGPQIIGNPYASAINFNNLTFSNYKMGSTTYNGSAGTIQGIGLTYYMWDPKTSGSSSVGKWITCSSNGDGTYTITPSTSDLPTDGIIQSGIAFSIKSDDANGTLTFHETDKVSTSSPEGISSRGTGSSQTISSLTCTLMVGTGAGAAISEGVVNSYHPGYHDEVDNQDAAGISTFNSNDALRIKSAGQYLAIERRSEVADNDTIFLSLQNVSKKAYTLQFKPANMSSLLTAVLEDNFTGTATPVSMNDTSSVAFSVTTDVKSGAEDRFKIVFKQIGVLPIKFSSLKAYQQNDNIAVQWTVENEQNMVKYEVEKSANGRDFTPVNTAKAKGNDHSTTTYNWLDMSSINGDNFYRIKSVSLNGSVEYSEIVKVSLGKTKTGVSVYPNPVKGGVIGLQLSNMPAGDYKIILTYSNGQVVTQSVINHGGGNATQTIKSSNYLSNGSYNLEVYGAGKKHAIKILVQSN